MEYTNIEGVLFQSNLIEVTIQSDEQIVSKPINGDRDLGDRDEQTPPSNGGLGKKEQSQSGVNPDFSWLKTAGAADLLADSSKDLWLSLIHIFSTYDSLGASMISTPVTTLASKVTALLLDPSSRLSSAPFPTAATLK